MNDQLYLAVPANAFEGDASRGGTVGLVGETARPPPIETLTPAVLPSESRTWTTSVVSTCPGGVLAGRGVDGVAPEEALTSTDHA